MTCASDTVGSTMRMVTIVCACGGERLVGANNATRVTRCDACQAEHRKLYGREWDQQRRATPEGRADATARQLAYWICGDQVDINAFHIDHIVPLARDGLHTLANVQPAHPVCNLRKGDRMPCRT